ncbi:MAG TPA: DsbA family protein [Acidimicrobiales bacterium]
MATFDLSFDYRCPFAKNMHLHVITALRAGADFDVTFMPWSLSQGSRPEGAPDVWNDPAYDGDLLSLAVGVSLRDQQPDVFLNAHEALFRARHGGRKRLVTLDEIGEVLVPLGIDTSMVADDVASRRPHDVIAASHKEFDRFEAFGVPTFVVNDQATFVRYMDEPSEDAQASVELITTLVNMMASRPALNEFKHTQLPA